MKIGLYPGSFNPWHKGHEDVLQKALKVFDKVHVLFCHNPDKKGEELVELMKETSKRMLEFDQQHKKDDKIYVSMWSKSLVSFVKVESKIDAVIRGLRNGDDLQYEMNQQYWNEDVGVDVPFVYFITDRKLSHISSSAIRTVNKLGLKHDYT